mgnify:CR=1 FL=1
MLASAQFWVLVSFLVLLAVCAYYGLRPTLKMLDDRAERIRKQLSEAEGLREEAQRELQEAQRLQRQAKKDAEDIAAHARTEAERIRENAKAEVGEQMERRERLTNQRIEQREREAMAEIRGRAADVAVAATERILRDNLTDNKANNLVDSAIQDVRQQLYH